MEETNIVYTPKLRETLIQQRNDCVSSILSQFENDPRTLALDFATMNYIRNVIRWEENRHINLILLALGDKQPVGLSRAYRQTDDSITG